MGFIVFIIAIVGIVWGAILALRGSLVMGCAVYLIIASCFSGYFWSIDAVGLTWSIDRFFMMFLLLAVVVQWRLGESDIKPLSRADFVLFGFLGLLVLRTFTADWRASGADDESIFMHLVNGYFIPLTILLIARHTRLDETKLRGAYIALACFGVYLALTAVAEGAHAWGLVFPEFIADPELGTHFGRARGPMLQSARLGMYLIVSAAVTVALCAWSGKWSRQAVVMVAALTPCYLVAAYFTYTRSIWLGAAFVLLITLVATLHGKWRALVILGSLGGAAFIVLAKGESLVSFKRDTTAAETAESTYMRASFAYVSWLMFQDRPVMGVGFGQFPNESTYYLSDRSTSLRLESIRGYIHHNTFLSVLVELGIFGLLLLLVFYFLWSRQAWQLWRDETLPFWVRAHGLMFLLVVAPFLLQMLFREVSYAPIENGLVFFFAGTMGSLHASYAAAQPKSVNLNYPNMRFEGTT